MASCFSQPKDSSEIEFDFYELASIPFYKPAQSNIETSKAYVGWFSKQGNSVYPINVKLISDSSIHAYAVYELQDANRKFYRLLAREGDVFMSIKFFHDHMSMEGIMTKLDVLYSINSKEFR